MAEPETKPDEISIRAAEAAADVTEAERPQDRQRLAAAFTRAASSSARVAGRGTRAVGRQLGAAPWPSPGRPASSCPSRSRVAPAGA